MKYISICSGIEAATVAWHGMGWQPLAFSEIEPFPAAVLGHHYPDVPNLGDMTDYLNWPEELLLECDLLVGGTPCQAFSVAGKRESLGDERGNLSLVFCNLFHHINEIRRRHGRPPAIVVWENVPGVLSTKDNAFGCFLAGIMGLDEAVETESGKWHKAGFLSGETVRVGYRIIDAQYFGVAQRRRRVFLVAVPCELVASLGERACPSEILSLRESVLGNPPTRGAAWEGVASGFADGSGGGLAKPLGSHALSKGRGTDLDNTTYVAFHPTQDPISSTDGSTHSMGCGSKQGCCTQAAAFTAKDSGADASRDVSPTMRAMGHSGSHANGGGQLAVAFQSNLGTRGGDVYEDGTSPTVRVGSGVGVPSPPAVAVRTANTSANGHGVAQEVSHTIDQVQGQAVAFTKSKRAQSSTDDESWVPGEVAPTQNQFDVGDSRATTVVAFKESQSGCRLGDVHATIDANKGSRRVEGVVAFAQNQLGEVRTNRDVMGTVNTNQNASGRNTPMVQQAMQVRRLTPTECERLQGFPDRYTDVTYRNKPAADGPRYKALGNSMAVPCMAWIGYRIEKATRH